MSADDQEKFGPFYCKAESVVGRAWVDPQASPRPEPKMSIHAPRQIDFETPDVNATIFCMAAHLHTASTTIQWFKDGNILDSGFTTTRSVTVGCSGYSIFSELTVSKKDWTSGKEFSCRVHNEMFSNIMNISYTDCSGPVEVLVETIPPSFIDIYLTKSAKLTCRISNLPFKEDQKELNVTWTRASDKKKLETIIGQPEKQENSGTFFVDATATICKEEWESEDTFECKVTHPLLPTAKTAVLTKLHGGTPSPPAVYVLPPPPEELALRETATLTCLLKGFYPKDTFVKWLRNNEPIEVGYFTSNPIQESKSPKQYSTYSMLTITEQDWSDGILYTCVVGHEALPFQTTQKTVDKKTGKPTLFNVSLVLSDLASTCY
ncbi:UNVERIFIED_CONTAM: hypothetical protein K2H54_043640 [Gekko kuhli]